MKKTTFFLTLTTMILFPTLLKTPLIPTAIANPTTWHVPGDFSTIQGAINAARPYDTILVAAGTYYEHLSISKNNLTILGENPQNTIIDGSQTSSAIFLNAKNVTITGFKIQNAIFGINMVQAKNCKINNNIVTANTEEGMRIWWESFNNTISDNTVTFNQGYGMRNMVNSNDNTITNNTLTGNKYGISVENSAYATLQNNNLTNNTYNFGVRGGYPQEFIHNIDTSNTINGKPIIYLTNQINLTIDPATCPEIGYLAIINSKNVTIKNVNISNNVQGILIGNTTDSLIQNVGVSDNLNSIQLIYSNNNQIRNSTFQPSLQQTTAIYLLNAKFNTINNNKITSNYKGIHLVNYATNNTITTNTLTSNTYAMFIEVYSSGNNIYHNNFVQNTQQVRNSWSNNTWDNGYPSGGNYWSDYTGEDINGDGIGDNPYIIDSSNQDNYPFMNPLGEEESVNIAITNVTANPLEAYKGEIVTVSVTIINQGTSPQTFSVTAFYDGNSIGTQTIISLAPNTQIVITFDWNTTTVSPQNYTIKAEATPVPGETNLNDNTFIDGTVIIKIPGDVNGDGVVDIIDLSLVSVAFGTFLGEPEYNPDADLNKDGIVDVGDISVVCINYGNTAQP